MTQAASFEGPFTLVVSVYPDEYSLKPKKVHKIPVQTLKEAQEQYKKISHQHSAVEGNRMATLGSGKIMKGSEEVAHVSPNGRVWEGPSKQWNSNKRELLANIVVLEKRLAGHADFVKWLDTFMEEKGIDLEQGFEVEGPSGTNHMTYQTVVDHMKIAPEHEQNQIKKMIVKLDFHNQKIEPFLKHLAQAIAF